MAITLKANVRWGGVDYAPGATIPGLTPSDEAGLVSSNRAEWVGTPSTTSNGAVPVMATTGPGGGNRNRGAVVTAGNLRSGLPSGRLQELLSWMRPTHLPILQAQVFAGMTPIVSGVMTISHDPTVGDFSGGSVKLAFSAGGTVSVRLPLPTPAEQGVSERTVRAGGAVHYRLRCDDWSKVTRLYLSLTQDGGSSNYWLGTITNNSKSQFGNQDPVYASRWNNAWRTFVLQSREFTKQGAADDWGLSAKYLDGIDGIYISAISTDAVNIWIDRIYSPDWPCAAVTPIFDGWYSTARALVKSEFLKRGWGAGGSANTVSQGTIYPNYADLKDLSDLGFDVFCHGHKLNAAQAATMTSDVSQSEFGAILAQQRMALFNSGANPVGMRWHQWLSNVGRGDFDVSAVLSAAGIAASRGDTIDGEFGINPWTTTAITNTSLFGSGSWVSKRGRFNRTYTAGYTNGANADYFAAGTEPTRQTLRESIAYAAMTAQVVTCYDHQILENPDTLNVSPQAMADRIADIDAREKSGELIVLNPTMVELLTYWRPGEFFLRWDGEWVYRHDPTKIAF